MNLIRSHACGLGEPFSKSSISHDDFTIEYIIKRSFRCHFRISETITIFINERIIPIIPQQGSLGASGDLAPLSHLALALIGEGKVLYRGEEKDSDDVLRELNRQPLNLQAKEGLALINGTQAMTAQRCH